jgi:hypothetical protein
MGGADAQSQAMAQLESSPYFQAISKQGENAIMQNASATGGLRGGNVQRALSEFRPQMMRQEIDRMAQYYQNLMGQGYNATNAQGQMGGQYAQGLSGLATGRGSAFGNLALGQMGDTNTINRDVSSRLQNYMLGQGQNQANYANTRGALQAEMWSDVGKAFGGGGGMDISNLMGMFGGQKSGTVNASLSQGGGLGGGGLGYI